MADKETPPVGAPPPPPAPEPASRELVEAASSTDPAIHRLLALRYIASMNEEQDVVDDVTAQLAELGWK